MGRDELRRMANEATPGPWSWFGNTKTHTVYLATVQGGRVYVMDFARWGMDAAQPRFQRSRGVMTTTKDLAVPEVDYRSDFHDIDNPDARYIAAASPDAMLALLDALERAEALRDEAEQRADICHANHEGAIRDLRDRLDRAEADVSRMADENANLRNRCAMLSFEEAEALLMLEKAEQNEASLRRQLASRTEAIQTSLATTRELRERAEKAERERDEARAERDALDRQLDEKHAKLVEIADKLYACRSERDARPDISAHDAAIRWTETREGVAANARIEAALDAHAAKVKP